MTPTVLILRHNPSTEHLQVPKLSSHLIYLSKASGALENIQMQSQISNGEPIVSHIRHIQDFWEIFACVDDPLCISKSS